MILKIEKYSHQMYHTALICKRKVIIVSRQQKIISEVGVFSTEISIDKGGSIRRQSYTRTE